MIAELAFVLIIAIAGIWFFSARGRTVKASLKNPSMELRVEIADSFILRAKGLMGRKNIKGIDGMLFLFDHPGRYSLWMFNTRIPLEAIFFDDTGKVVDIISMEPFSLQTHSPKADASYILEVKKGFCRKNGLKAGKSMLRLPVYRNIVSP